MSDAVTLMKQMGQEFATFKEANDRRLAAIEKNGHAPADLVAQVDKANARISEIQAQLDDVQKKAQRPAMDPSDPVKAERSKRFDAFLRANGLQASATSGIYGAVQVGDDSAGGYGVPETLDPMVEKYERDGSPMRQACSVKTLSSENYEKLVQQGVAATGWVGETETRDETTTPELAALKPYFGELYAEPHSTQKALEDIALNVEAWLAEEVGLAFAEQENTAFTQGNGSKKPKGILGYTLSTSVDGSRTFGEIQKVNSGSSGAFVAEKLIDVVHALHAKYRNGAAWMMSNLGIAAVRKLKDSTSGLYLFQPSFGAGQPATILGFPIIENEDVPDPAADANAAIFGNFQRAYTIYDVRGLSVLRDPFTKKGTVKFYTTKRVGGMVVNDRAVKVLTLT